MLPSPRAFVGNVFVDDLLSLVLFVVSSEQELVSASGTRDSKENFDARRLENSKPLHLSTENLRTKTSDGEQQTSGRKERSGGRAPKSEGVSFCQVVRR